MPSNRRLKAFLMLLGVAILLTIYMQASARQTRTSQFYTRTSDALAAARARKEAKLREAESAVGEHSDGVSGRLRAAEVAAKKEADRKGDAFHGEDTKQKVIDVKEKWDMEDKKKGASQAGSRSEDAVKVRPEGASKGVAGRKFYRDGKQVTLKEDSTHTEDVPAKSAKQKEDEEKAHKELDSILKRSPVIIFSKTYCPHSKRAKHILLEKYKINPAPYVVELDTHPLGPSLQSYLGELTGRKTVPNVMINAKSIGGGDDVQSLDESGKLEETVRGMGGKRMKIVKVVTEGERNRRV